MGGLVEGALEGTFVFLALFDLEDEAITKNR